MEEKPEEVTRLLLELIKYTLNRKIGKQLHYNDSLDWTAG